MSRPTFFGPLLLVAGALLCCILSGCGQGANRVYGTVEFKGKPVPAGKIYFQPDGSKGNSGPTGYAEIRGGQYDTSAAGGRGVVSGPVIVRLTGIDPSARPEKEESEDAKGKVLFPSYEFAFEVPAGGTSKDIKVPAEAEKGPVQPADKKPVIIP